MMRSLIPAILFTSPLFAQLPIVDFEDAGAFDLTGVHSYCNMAAVQGSSDTYGPGSLWSLEFSTFFNGTCPGVASGIFISLSDVAPGDHFTVDHWQKTPAGAAIYTTLVYAYPATGALPTDENDLVYWGPSTAHLTAPDVWSQGTSTFALPTTMPWPADIYMLFHPAQDMINNLSIRIDDVQLNPDVSTGLSARSISSTDLRIAPLPAQDVVHISGMQAGLPVSVHACSGVLVTTVSPPLANGAWNVQGLATGVYILRQGDRWVRFVKT